MRKVLSIPMLIDLGLLAALAGTRAVEQKADDRSWKAEFPVEKEELSSAGRNPISSWSLATSSSSRTGMSG